MADSSNWSCLTTLGKTSKLGKVTTTKNHRSFNPNKDGKLSGESYGTEGRRFESCWARKETQGFTIP